MPDDPAEPGTAAATTSFNVTSGAAALSQALFFLFSNTAERYRVAVGREDAGVHGAEHASSVVLVQVARGPDAFGCALSPDQADAAAALLEAMREPSGPGEDPVPENERVELANIGGMLRKAAEGCRAVRAGGSAANN